MLLPIVIPVFNEANTLSMTIARMRDALRGVNWEIIFVNDGSTDPSWEIMRHASVLLAPEPHQYIPDVKVSA